MHNYHLSFSTIFIYSFIFSDALKTFPKKFVIENVVEVFHVQAFVICMLWRPSPVAEKSFNALNSFVSIDSI